MSYINLGKSAKGAAIRASRPWTQIFALLPLLLITQFGPALHAAEWCGELSSAYGPYDYTNPQHRTRHLGVVEKVHFTEDVRTLRKGSSSYLARDIEYVLAWFPNHHPALDALARLAIREGRSRPSRARADLECRFKWALDVKPDDAMVRVIQGLYHLRLGRNQEARDFLKMAVDLQPDHAEVHYNLGLVLFRLEDYETARTHAEQAYALGYPLPGLKNMLEGAGYGLSR